MYGVMLPADCQEFQKIRSELAMSEGGGKKRGMGPTKEQIATAESTMAAILAIAADAIIELDEYRRITQFNYGAEKIFGYGKDEVIGRSVNLLIPDRFRERHDEHVGNFAASGVAARRMGERREIFGLRKDGSEFPAEASITQLGETGSRIFMVVVRDVTERKRYEALLAQSNAELEARVMERTAALEAESQRREEARAALIQAQRMEAFGQLTGGIAHDFNNLLAIVLGNLELLGARVTEEEASDLIKRAVGAAEMGARLTTRLLTFARRRPLAPTLLNANDLMLGIAELLKRALGERITLTTVLARALWQTRADPSELENAVINLAINARDAMMKGGKLVIETENVSIGDDSPIAQECGAGDYVAIRVTDTGSGMSPQTLKRAFEPFFTTKEGRGTGLGLSTIYGFARQSGGHVSIESQLGHGTTVTLYLPKVDASPAATNGKSDEVIPLSENCETVLVVEDNAELCEIVLKRIEALGYVVLSAPDASAAIAMLESEPDIALVFSDIVLGSGPSGFDLGLWVRAHKPGVKVLLTTGYASDAAGGEKIEEEFEVLHKPYSRKELAVALHTALNAPSD